MSLSRRALPSASRSGNMLQWIENFSISSLCVLDTPDVSATVSKIGRSGIGCRFDRTKTADRDRAQSTKGTTVYLLMPNHTQYVSNIFNHRVITQCFIIQCHLYRYLDESVSYLQCTPETVLLPIISCLK